MPARDGQGGAPPADSIDAEIEAYHRRVGELSKDGKMTRREAGQKINREDNAELVKSNAAAPSPTRAPSSEPAKPPTRSAEQGPAQRSSPLTAADRSYSYEHASMASQGFGAVRHAQAKERFRAKQHADRQGPEGEKAKPSQTSSPDKEIDRKTAAGPDADRSQRYRELMKASEARQHSRGPSGPDHSRD